MRAVPFCIVLCALLGSGCAASRLYVSPAEVGWETQSLPPDSLLRHRVYLVGETDAPSADGAASVLRLLRHRLEGSDARSTVVFLGGDLYSSDLYSDGRIDSAETARPEAGSGRREQIRSLQALPGRVLLLPGERGRAHGTALPGSTGPGPVEVELDRHLTLVAIDTEALLRSDPTPLAAATDEAPATLLDVLTGVDDVVRRRREDDLLVVGHHPVFSNGRHAGRFPLRAHLFPLTTKWKRVYVPLPVLGTLYVLYRKYVGGRGDFADAPYRRLREGLSRIFAQHEGLVYAAAHDRSLQYLPVGSQHYVVSGSGSGTSYAASGGAAAFTASRPGFAMVHYYRDGQVWLTFLEPTEDEAKEDGATADGSSGRLLFQTRLRAAEQDAAQEAEQASGSAPEATHLQPDYTDSTMTVAAGPRYATTALGTLLAGSEHRGAWTTPVTAPVLDLGRVAGGLVPIRSGGGLQTLTLHLQGADGHEYRLRSIDKDASKTLPRALRGTFASGLVQDQTASLFPFSPLVATALAGAAGVLHTNPRLVFVPDDPRLGAYREQVQGRLMFLDVDADGDVSDVLHLDGAKEVVGAANLYRHLTADNDDRVDQAAFARARLLDLLMSDWDRGADQWRWAAYDDPDGKGTLYRPIPRDRDFAFNRMNGLFPTLAPYVLGRYQDFGPHFGSLRRLTLNGFTQDRRLLNELSRQDWLRIADTLRARLTDDRVDAAVRALPGPIYDESGAWLSRNLKLRRDRLTHVAEAFYRMNSEIVDVVGSDRHEFFEVTRFDDSTRVTVFKTDREGATGRQVYRRTFFPGETRELRLFGLAGNDRFAVTGRARRGIRVIAVGGPGNDAFADHAVVEGGRRTTRFYDDDDPGNTWDTGPETHVVRSANPEYNTYDARLFSRDEIGPRLFVGSNDDDGLFLGGGVLVVEQDLRRRPYARSHRIVANAAVRTGAFNVVYGGHFVGIVGAWDGVLDAFASTPNTVHNFYGLGNETTRRDVADYRARLARVRVAPGLMMPLATGAFVSAGPTVRYTNVRKAPGTLPASSRALPALLIGGQLDAGLQAGFRFGDVDDAVWPTRGFRFTGAAGVYQSLVGAAYQYGTLDAEVVFYVSPAVHLPATLAVRLGGGLSTGTVPFYETRTLGGTTNLRGYRSTRFSGTSSLYQSTELRLRLVRFSAYLSNNEAGLLGFFDAGRVWAPDESSRVWHCGYGGGLWVRFFDRVLVTGTVGFSAEDRTFLLGTGFFY